MRIQDLYARVLSPTIAGSINQLEYGLAAFDYNVGGRGERLRIALADQSYIGKSAELSFSKRRLLGSEHSVFARAYGSVKVTTCSGYSASPSAPLKVALPMD